MPAFGDVLRNLGSVLNPQVAQLLGEEQRQQRGEETALQKSLGMLMLNKQIEQQSPEYQAKVEALKNEKAFREAVAGADGDIVKIAGAAAQYKPELAISLFNQQEQRAARIQQAKDALDMKQMQITQNYELAQQRLTDAKDKAAAEAQHKQMVLELQKDRNAIAAQSAKAQQEMKAMQFQMNSDRDLVTKTRNLQGALEKANLPQADAVLSDVEKALEGKGIAAYLASKDSLKPDWMIPDEAKFARQAFQKLFNITLKDRSGAAVTNQELERLKQEFATGVWKSAKQIENGVEKARGIINRHYASVAAGYGPDALRSYNDNLRSLGGKIVLDPDAGKKKEDPLGIR